MSEVKYFIRRFVDGENESMLECTSLKCARSEFDKKVMQELAKMGSGERVIIDIFISRPGGRPTIDNIFNYQHERFEAIGGGEDGAGERVAISEEMIGGVKVSDELAGQLDEARVKLQDGTAEWHNHDEVFGEEKIGEAIDEPMEGIEVAPGEIGVLTDDEEDQDSEPLMDTDGVGCGKGESEMSGEGEEGKVAKTRVVVNFKNDSYMKAIICGNADEFDYKPGNRWEFTDMDTGHRFIIPVEAILYMTGIDIETGEDE